MMDKSDVANLYRFMSMSLRLQAAILEKLINPPQEGRAPSPVIMNFVGEAYQLAHELESWRKQLE